VLVSTVLPGHVDMICSILSSMLKTFTCICAVALVLSLTSSRIMRCGAACGFVSELVGVILLHMRHFICSCNSVCCAFAC
jgi:hypothetical protein